MPDRHASSQTMPQSPQFCRSLRGSRQPRPGQETSGETHDGGAVRVVTVSVVATVVVCVAVTLMVAYVVTVGVGAVVVARETPKQEQALL